MDRFVVADHVGFSPEAGVQWIAGLDPAFGRDAFGVALVGRDVADRSRLLLGHVDGIKPRRANSLEERTAVTAELLDQVAETCLHFKATAVTDQHAAPQVVDRLRRAGVPIRTHAMTATSKTAIFQELRMRLYGGKLEIYNDVQLMAELRRLRSKFTAGSAAVVNPRVGGSHGDRAQALAMAVFEHRASTTHGERRPRDEDRARRSRPVTSAVSRGFERPSLAAWDR